MVYFSSCEITAGKYEARQQLVLLADFLVLWHSLLNRNSAEVSSLGCLDEN